MNTCAEFELSYQLNAGAIDATKGTITGATVAQAGVKALGKFIFLDKSGKLTRDEDEATEKLPVYTDEETLDTLMAATSENGGVFKIRSDHDDSLDARAGYAVNFRRDGNRVAADLKLNDSYRDRDIVLETAAKTPRLIGLSIDMVPSFEITGKGEERRAMMRIDRLIAVDIVDQGAITHDGIFLSAKVDKSPTLKSSTKMPDEKKTAPTIEECMSQIGKVAEQMAGMQASIAKLAAPVAAPGADEALKASIGKMTEQMSAINETVLNMKKDMSAMGLKAGAAPTEAEAAEETKRLKLKAEADAAAANKPKSYKEQVAALKASDSKMSGAEAHRAVMKSDPKAYEAHQREIGVLR
jgi:hypothetical protein